MIEKTFKVSKNGTIDQDFKNRSISQYLHNAVQVNVDIPNECFENLDNYGVELAVAICDATGYELEKLSTLFMIKPLKSLPNMRETAKTVQLIKQIPLLL